MLEMPVTAAHGTRSRYVRGCRCARCTKANTKYGRALKKRIRRTHIPGPHGTRSHYVRGCRCDPCTEANGEYGRTLKRKPPDQRKKYVRSETPGAHGTRSRYIRGCRCDPCIEANTEYGRTLKQRDGHQPPTHQLPCSECNQLVTRYGKCTRRKSTRPVICDDCRQARRRFCTSCGQELAGSRYNRSGVGTGICRSCKIANAKHPAGECSKCHKKVATGPRSAKVIVCHGCRPRRAICKICGKRTTSKGSPRGESAHYRCINRRLCAFCPSDSNKSTSKTRGGIWRCDEHFYWKWCTCIICETKFAGPNIRYCPEHRPPYKPATKPPPARIHRTARVEPYKRSDIFERDKWICGICRKPINPNLIWPHDWCGVIDHRIPLARGGDDTPENVQAAHHLCNLKKWAKPQLALSKRRNNKTAAQTQSAPTT